MTTIQMPTQDEIVARIKERQEGDSFGFEWQEYVSFLDFEHAKQYLKDDTKAENWEASSLDRKEVLKMMADYMEFAWGKANGCRGFSANRSIMHYVAWAWLAGDGAFSEEISRLFSAEYRFYGKDILVRICEFYGWDSKQWDDGRRMNREYE